jgi:hypothetical protein
VAELDRTASNRQLARIVAEVADALAEYNHLPAMAGVTVYADGDVRLNPDYAQNGAKKTLVVWAQTFSSPIVIDMSSSGYLRTVVQLAGRETKVELFITQRGAYELGAALQIPVSPGGQVEVSAEALLAVLDGEQVPA